MSFNRCIENLIPKWNDAIERYLSLTLLLRIPKEIHRFHRFIVAHFSLIHHFDVWNISRNIYFIYSETDFQHNLYSHCCSLHKCKHKILFIWHMNAIEGKTERHLVLHMLFLTQKKVKPLKGIRFFFRHSIAYNTVYIYAEWMVTLVWRFRFRPSDLQVIAWKLNQICLLTESFLWKKKKLFSRIKRIYSFSMGFMGIFRPLADQFQWTQKKRTKET